MLGQLKALFEARTRVDALKTNRRGGDVVTTLLCYALERGIIAQALVVKMSEEEPCKAVATIATTKAELIQASGSKYVYVPHAQLRKQMTAGAVVGLPCQMQQCPEQFLRIGLFCGLNLSSRGLQYALKWHGIDEKQVVSMDYRAPGTAQVRVELRNGHVTHFRVNRLPLFFAYEMCLHCTDFSAHEADIAVGDRNFQGWSTVIVRTNKGEDLFSRAVADQHIEANEITEEDVLNARTSSMLQKEVGGGYANTMLVRVRGKWIEALPPFVLDLLGGAYIFYQRHLKFREDSGRFYGRTDRN